MPDNYGLNLDQLARFRKLIADTKGDISSSFGIYDPQTPSAGIGAGTDQLARLLAHRDQIGTLLLWSLLPLNIRMAVYDGLGPKQQQDFDQQLRQGNLNSFFSSLILKAAHFHQQRIEQTANRVRALLQQGKEDEAIDLMVQAGMSPAAIRDRLQQAQQP